MNRRKPIQRSQSKPENPDGDEDFFDDHLADLGLVTSLANDLTLQDVPQNMRYVCAHMFEPIPEKGGMNSTRIAEVLNFRRSLPPIVTVAHIHALIGSPTMAEREIAQLIQAGVARKIIIPGRGMGASSISDGLILNQNLESLLAEASCLDQAVKGIENRILRALNPADCLLLAKFWQHLQDHPSAIIMPLRQFLGSEITALMRAGFLTTISPSSGSANIFTPPKAISTGTTTSLLSISKASSGSVAAVGGDGAIHGAGNTGKDGTIRRISSEDASTEPETLQLPRKGAEYQFAVPNTGLYLKLLTAARSHLLSLLVKTSFRELPVYLLRERWHGGIGGDDSAVKAKKYRGEFTGVLPGRTRHWKQFSGLAFDWILAECLGAGLVEVFETGSVGRAVRLI